LNARRCSVVALDPVKNGAHFLPASSSLFHMSVSSNKNQKNIHSTQTLRLIETLATANRLPVSIPGRPCIIFLTSTPCKIWLFFHTVWAYAGAPENSGRTLGRRPFLTAAYLTLVERRYAPTYVTMPNLVILGQTIRA